MNKSLAIIGIISGITMFIGLFTPWLELYSAPYMLEGARIKDYAEVSGWDLSQGNIRVIQMIESQEYLRWEYYRTMELHVESKFYPYLCLIGGFLSLIGGAEALRVGKSAKAPNLLIFLGGMMAFISGCLGFLDNRWITPRAIIIEKYVIFGYYKYGLLICFLSGLLGIIGCLFVKGID